MAAEPTVFAELYRRRESHIKPGLDRISKAFEQLKKPAFEIPCVLIGGTNGKGTTAAFLWQMLSGAGLKCGLFTSPHLIHYRERFVVTGEEIDDAFLVATIAELKLEIEAELFASLSFFELSTLLAFKVFNSKKVDFVVWEVGMGGRWDTTNICDPLASIITTISYDHQKFLGNDLSDIALEKLGIVRGGRPVFLGFSKLEDPRATVLVNDFLNTCDVENVVSEQSSTHFLQRNEELARRVYHFLRSSHSHLFAAKTSQRVQKPACLAARGELVNYFGRQILFDVCHNLEGARELERTIAAQGFNAPPAGLVCVLNDKDINNMLDILRGILKPLMLFKIDNDRCMRFGQLDERHRDLKFARDFGEAWDWLAKSCEPKVPLVVCGSVHAVGEVFAKLGIDPSSQHPTDRTKH